MKVTITDSSKSPSSSVIGEFYLSKEVVDHLKDEKTITIKMGGLYTTFGQEVLNIFVARKDDEFKN